LEVSFNLLCLLNYLTHALGNYIVLQDKALLHSLIDLLINTFYGRSTEFIKDTTYLLYNFHKLNYLIAENTQRYTSVATSIVSTLEALDDEHDRSIKNALSMIVTYIKEGAFFFFFLYVYMYVSLFLFL
jgi:hypothetical protein